MRLFLLSLACAAAFETDWPEDVEEFNLLLLQVQQRLTKTEVFNTTQETANEAMSFFQADQDELLPFNRSTAEHWAPLRHWSVALLLSRSASRLLTQGHSPDIIGEIVHRTMSSKKKKKKEEEEEEEDEIHVFLLLC
ncbi:unnamed protein product [Durusdinium trenchii]|uniref:Uncharacterized protein n=2 Tax=Durusdinium trenchii TaxID=1381693 RepID=A0ABP0Q178_9DINO